MLEDITLRILNLQDSPLDEELVHATSVENGNITGYKVKLALFTWVPQAF
jgi:hypothetical protein